MNAADNMNMHQEQIVGEYTGRLSTRLGLARMAANMSPRDLADAAGMKEEDVLQFESGTREPSVGEIRRLARSTDSSADYLLATRHCIDDCYRAIAL